MEKKPANSTLLEDLEAIRASLESSDIADPAGTSDIPTLEDIVGLTPPKSVNPNNPFLSSQSLSELLRIRKEAEEKAAAELASLQTQNINQPAVKNHDTPVSQEATDVVELDEQPTPHTPFLNQNTFMQQIQPVFDEWAEKTIKQRMSAFEDELRTKLYEDFKQIAAQWFRANQGNAADISTDETTITPPRP